MSDPQNPILKVLFENQERLRQTMTRENTAMPGGILPVVNGGTGLALYAVGDLITASGTTTLARLADVATGNVLRSGGVNTIPAYGKVVLTTDVSDYTTATWTPTYRGSLTAGVTTYVLQQGRYIRIGNLVVATGLVQWSAASGTGNAQISLPFTAQATQYYSLPVVCVGVTFASGTPQGQIDPSTAVFTMLSAATNAAGTYVAVEAVGTVIFTATFFV